MIGVILAGGEGTRLRPLTYEIPKALIPVQGKTLTDQALAVLQAAGVTEAVLGISYLAEKIREYFNQHPYPGIKIDYVVEEKPMGTAGPLVLLKRMGKVFDSDFIVVNGDNLFAFDFEDWKKFHQERGGVATIALKSIDDVASRGVVAMAGDKITAFVEKPKPEEAPSNLINSGYYIFSPKIFDYIDETKDFLMLEKDIFPALAQAGKLYGYVGNGQWFDTGTLERWQTVEKEWRGV